MVPLATRAFLVTPDGDLENGDWRVAFQVSANGKLGLPPRAIAAEDRWLPVLRWNRNAGEVRFEFEAVAFSEPAPRDTGLLVSMVVRAMNRGSVPATIHMGSSLVEGSNSSYYLAADAPPRATALLRWADGPDRGESHAWSDAPAADRGVATEATLAPGASQEFRFLLPAYPTAAADLRHWARTSHPTRLDQARRRWTDEMGRATRFQLNDAEVENAVLAARVVLLSCTEHRGSALVPIGNPFQYRDVWLRDGARSIRALAVSGHVETARSLARGQALFQWPSGAFLSQRGQLDGTGQAMWAMDQAMSRPKVDRKQVLEIAGSVRAAWHWLERQRKFSRESGWEFGGLLPAAEPRDNEMVRGQLVGNDAWGIAGYAAAARLMDASGEHAVAESIRVSRGSYVKDFEVALVRTGSPDIPPAWQPGGKDWGNLTASVPCGVLRPSDSRMTALAARYWNKRGGAGLGWYGSTDSLHTYLGADLATWALLSHRPASADSVLREMLEYRTANGGGGELFVRSTREFGSNLPPHITAAASMVSLVRDMLIYDDDDTLRLTMGARAAWWRGGSVQGAPTRFGNLDLHFERRETSAHWKWTPVAAWTVLTLPPGTRVEAPVQAPLLARSAGQEILVPPGTGEIQVGITGDPNR